MAIEDRDVVAFITTKEQKAALAQWADEMRTSTSTIARQIVAEALEKRAARKSKQRGDK